MSPTSYNSPSPPSKLNMHISDTNRKVYIKDTGVSGLFDTAKKKLIKKDLLDIINSSPPIKTLNFNNDCNDYNDYNDNRYTRGNTCGNTRGNTRGNTLSLPVLNVDYTSIDIGDEGFFISPISSRVPKNIIGKTNLNGEFERVHVQAHVDSGGGGGGSSGGDSDANCNNDEKEQNIEDVDNASISSKLSLGNQSVCLYSYLGIDSSNENRDNNYFCNANSCMISNKIKNLTQHEIKKAYHKQAMIYHPDKLQIMKDPIDSIGRFTLLQRTEAFTLISKAYKILYHPKKKIIYDCLRKFKQSLRLGLKCLIHTNNFADTDTYDCVLSNVHDRKNKDEFYILSLSPYYQ